MRAKHPSKVVFVVVLCINTGEHFVEDCAAQDHRGVRQKVTRDRLRESPLDARAADSLPLTFRQF